MTAFTIPGSALSRLARLAQATEVGDNGVICHIAVRVTLDACRFTATDGKLLASIVHAITALQGDPVDAILDREQFTAACKLLSKHHPSRVTVTIAQHEIRFTAGTVSAVIRRRDGTYPPFDHIWSKTVGMQWVPCTSSLNLSLAASAQQIAGKAALSFSTPVPMNSAAQRLWSSASPGEFGATLPLTELQGALRAPAYWADHELAILLMPISRAGSEKQLDLSRFVLPAREAVGVAA